MGDWSGVMATASPEPGVPIWRNRDEVEGGAGGVVQLVTVLSVQYGHVMVGADAPLAWTGTESSTVPSVVSSTPTN
jgi:hypothetical protein